MNELSINELRSIQLDILQDVHEFCKNQNLRYSLCGGTLLGAVRHQGYIPWDDDIDIMMPREDYDKFISIYTSKDNYLIDFIRVKSYRETFVKVCKKDTMMEDHWGRTNLGINIDVFPIDGVSNKNPKEYIDKILYMKDKIARFCPYYIHMPSKKYMWFLKYIFKRIIFFQFNSVLRLKNVFNDMLRKHSIGKCKYSGVISGSYGHKEVVESNVFLKYTKLEFEKHKFSAISNYDAYLTAIYGNYMQLPPKEKRCHPHKYKAFLSTQVINII